MTLKDDRYGEPPLLSVMDDWRKIKMLEDAHKAINSVRAAPNPFNIPQYDSLDWERREGFAKTYEAGPGLKFIRLKQGGGIDSLGCLKKMSLRVMRVPKAPVYSIGLGSEPVAFVRGKRAIAGTLTLVNPTFDTRETEGWDELRICALDGQRTVFCSLVHVLFVNRQCELVNETINEVEVSFVADDFIPWREEAPGGPGWKVRLFTSDDRTRVVGEKIGKDIQEAMGKFIYSPITPHFKQAVLATLDEVLSIHHRMGTIYNYQAYEDNGCYIVRFRLSFALEPEGHIRLRLPWSSERHEEVAPIRNTKEVENLFSEYNNYWKESIAAGMRVPRDLLDVKPQWILDLETQGLLTGMNVHAAKPVETYFDLPLDPPGTIRMVESMLKAFVVTEDGEWAQLEGDKHGN